MAADRDRSDPSADSVASTESIAGHPFARVPEGYDPAEVRAFLAGVADEVAGLRSRHEELVSRLARSERQAAALGRRLGLDEPARGGGEITPPETSRADADELLLQRRDADLDDLVGGMVRRLKRVLQDEHNDLLDQLRRVGGVPTAAVLSARDLSAARYAAAARPFVEQAAAAGARFVTPARPPPAGAAPTRHHVQLTGSGPGTPAQDVEAVVAAVTAPAVDAAVAEIVEPLRRRIEAVLDERGGDAPDVLVDTLASVYRETRSHRIELLSADVLSAAHAEAAWRAAPEGSFLRWLAEDADGPCSDCDDNALGGPVARGEPFPTGQLHPPAHRGCRCLLVLVPARGAGR
jgi:DivIVA domain-containing protein